MRKYSIHPKCPITMNGSRGTFLNPGTLSQNIRDVDVPSRAFNCSVEISTLGANNSPTLTPTCILDVISIKVNSKLYADLPYLHWRSAQNRRSCRRTCHRTASDRTGPPGRVGRSARPAPRWPCVSPVSRPRSSPRRPRGRRSHAVQICARTKIALFVFWTVHNDLLLLVTHVDSTLSLTFSSRVSLRSSKSAALGRPTCSRYTA